MEPGDHGLRPHFIRLAASARPAWENLMNGLTAEMNDEDFAPHLLGPWSKLKIYAARLALVVHLLRHVTDETSEKNVDAESVRRSALLVDYFRSQARKAYAVIGADREAEDARRVLRWAVREGRKEFKRWKAHKDLKNQGRFLRIEDLDGPLGRLMKHRYLRPKAPADKKGPGRTADPSYEVNPLWNRRENRVNRVNASGPPERVGATRWQKATSNLPIYPMVSGWIE